MDFQGYASIKSNATGITSAVPLDRFLGHVCRVMEFTEDGGALVLDPKATGLAMVEKEHIHRHFKCCFYGDYIIPTGLGSIEQALYVSRLQMRKGGYNEIVKNLVIGASLHKGEYNDNFLFQL